MIELTDEELTGAAYALLTAHLNGDEAAAARLARDVGAPLIPVTFGILCGALGRDRLAELIDLWHRRQLN
jgi:hypothetical protein